MKRRVVGAGLIVLGLWPLVQFALTQVYGVDPWKLFGFAMYTVPGPMKRVHLVQVSADGRYRMLDDERYAPEERAAVDRFRERRRALGELQGSDALAETVLAVHPDWEGVVVLVLSLELDRQTATMRPRMELERTHWRDGREAPFAFPRPWLDWTPPEAPS